MNQSIKQHFNAIEVRLIQSPVVVSYKILRQEIAAFDGKLRIKVTLSDGGIFELFEYVGESNGQIKLLKYSFHWQDVHGQLKKRWDNAPHFPHLPNAPHHVHYENSTVQGIMHTPDIMFVIEEIEKTLN